MRAKVRITVSRSNSQLPGNQHSVSGSPLQGPAACMHTQYWWLSPACRLSAPKSAGRLYAGQLWFQGHRPGAGPQCPSLLGEGGNSNLHMFHKLTTSWLQQLEGGIIKELPKRWRFVSSRRADSNSSWSLSWMAVSACRWCWSQQAYCSLVRIWHTDTQASSHTLTWQGELLHPGGPSEELEMLTAYRPSREIHRYWIQLS